MTTKTFPNCLYAPDGSIYVTLTDGAGNLVDLATGTAGGLDGQIQFNSGATLAGFTASGDAVIDTSTGVVTVTKTNGTAFGVFATGTDASNLTGTVASARLSGAYTDITGLGTLTGLTSSGNVVVTGDLDITGFSGFGHTPGTTDRILIFGSGNTSATNSLRVLNTDFFELLTLRDDGIVILGTTIDNTTASAANLFIDSATGQLSRSTSSLRYKDVVGSYDRGMAGVNSMQPILFKAKGGDDTVFAGFGAEQLHDAGLTEFVGYDKEGRPDEVRYGHITAALVSGLQELDKRFSAIEGAL